MRIRIHPFYNGAIYGWSKLRSLFDFFFPYSKNGKYHYIRKEAVTCADSKNGAVLRDFYTFRAFAWHCLYTLIINPVEALQIELLKLNQMRYELLVFLAIQNPQLMPFVALPIGLDASTSGGSAAGDLTFSHTTSGSNRILFVHAGQDSVGNTDNIVGTTYAATAMTTVDVFRSPGAGGSEFFMLVNPAAGANNIVIDITNTETVYGTAASYTGAAQSGQPDASGGTASDPATSVTGTITVVAQNCWIATSVGKKQGSAAVLSAGTGVTSRQINGFSAIGDSNGTVATGNQSMTWNASASTGLAIHMASFAPAAEVGGKGLPIMWG